ncbi:MAG: tetratricopeptide repeat protein, partial [Myxococcales bacterium]|nr:tetratricopeptide repeat protein [Myxococcales bacterium]
DVDAALAGVWDDGRRDALRGAYARSDLVYAEAAGARAIAALDAYAEAWSAASRAACEAARDGDPEGLAQLRRRCLREARTIVDARAQLLATADDAVIDATERLVAGLRPLAECDDADLLRSELPLPADPLERGAVDDLRRRLAAIDARLSAGQIELGLEQVAAVLRDAEATAYAPVLAEATFREAALLRQHQRFDDAEAAGLRAYGLAEEADHRRLRAEIANEMIYVAGRAGQENAATLWATIAAALLRGLPRADALAARYRRNLAAMRFFLGDFEAAATEAAAAVEAADAAFGPDHPEALDVRSNYGAILAVRGDDEGALDVLGRALADAERLHGATHPRIANILQNISVSELSLKRYDDALGHVRRERAIREAVYGRDHANLFPSTCNLATTLISAGRVDEAAPELERCAALAARHFEPESRDAALVAMIQCSESEARGRLDEAAERCQRGLALRSAILGADHPETAQSELRLADILALQGRCDDAHARWQAAEAVLRAKSPDRAPSPAPKCVDAEPKRGR